MSLSRRTRRLNSLHVESLETRNLLTAAPLPVLLVIADQHDFYYQEYGDTRASLLAAGVPVVVAATTTNVSLPHPGTGQPWGTDGAVTPDIALGDAVASDYSAIAFVGGWGASMYQYAFNDPDGDGVTNNYYAHGAYNGDDNLYDGVVGAGKLAANNLINAFLAADKPVAGLCHGVLVLAWARVDGVSPLDGKTVSVPIGPGAPVQFYNDAWHYNPYTMGQYDQAIDNGATPNSYSGQYGAPGAFDDVVVDGRIITGENYDSAALFGSTIAAEVWAMMPAPPENHAPVMADASMTIAENSPVGTAVGQVTATDADAGQTLTYQIVGGNDYGTFAIDPATGVVTVANVAALNFEAVQQFSLTVRVSDDGDPSMEDFAVLAIDVTNVYEPAVVHNGNLYLTGTAWDDTIYVWSTAEWNVVSACVNGVNVGTFRLPSSGRVVVDAGSGHDRVYATDARISVALYGGDGNDCLVGGSASDYLDGGAGGDKLWANAGDDLLAGGAGSDYLYGREGNDVIVGGDGDDYAEGFDGRDLIFGGFGNDNLRGDAGDDLLVGGRTAYDNDCAALLSLRAAWLGSGDLMTRIAAMTAAGSPRRLWLGETVFDDGYGDVLIGGDGADWSMAHAGDWVYMPTAEDHVCR